MPDRGDAEVAIQDAHEEFIQHIEDGRSKIRLLSIITIVVAFLLLASYSSQLVLPLASGSATVTVNLLDPGLVALELLLIALTAAWLYVGVVNYLFATRLGRSIQEARAKEREIEKRIS